MRSQAEPGEFVILGEATTVALGIKRLSGVDFAFEFECQEVSKPEGLCLVGQLCQVFLDAGRRSGLPLARELFAQAVDRRVGRIGKRLQTAVACIP